MTLKINKINIGRKYPPFIIAEMSGNHNQSLNIALKIVRAAAKAGVHAIKLQTYTPDTITIDCNKKNFFIKNKKNIWSGQKLYDLYKKAYTPWEWHKPIMKEAKKNGLVCFSTPFDMTAIDYLEKLNVPAYKIASFENNDLPLIEKAAKTGKPLIISIGMANINDLKEIYKTVKKTGNSNLILLKCTSCYPASAEDSNLLTIQDLKKLFNCEIGLSDHTLGIGVSIAAVALGATVIEKHFTIDRKKGGVDSKFSLEPQEFKSLVYETKQAWKSIGKIMYGPTKSEKDSLKYRRSLFIVKDMKKNEVFSKENIKSIRPGQGLAPKYINNVIGQKITKNTKKGTPLNWNLIK